MLEGIHSVFKGMPLYWGRGYLGRVLAVMERAASQDVKLPKDMVTTYEVPSFLYGVFLVFSINTHNKKKM